MKPGTSGWVDHVVTPVGALALIVAEDTLDRYFVKWVEERTGNRVWRASLRMLFNPGRSLANVASQRMPWDRQDRPIDYVLRLFSLAGLSMPSFWLAMIVILLLVRWIGMIPSMTYVSPFDNLGANLFQFLLPALAVGYRSSALIMRITRSTMLEVLREDYIRTAWAKGQRERFVVWRHAFKNASLPVITVIGIEFAFLIGGLIVTETVFNLPGVARYLVDAIQGRAYPIVQNLAMLIAVVVVFANLTVDLLYTWLDPRIKYGRA